jgi:hypothetical protein
MKFCAIIVASMLSLSTNATAQEVTTLTMGAPFGAAWGATYGFASAKAGPFVEQARELGAAFTRVTLYWSQLEPRQGSRRWDDLDAYVSQLRSPAEGILTLASASPWATRTSTWVFPSSPAKDAEAYYAFVRATVEHVRGKVKYFQNDPEPNNPFFWAGTVDELIGQQKIFHRAVKDADPDAVVVLAGCDGLFDPDGRPTMPQQAASLAFFKRLIADAADDYDVFDLRLYGDPYTIPKRAALIRGLIDNAGGHQPIIATEYAGPSFFEFANNRRWFVALQGPAASATVNELMAKEAELPIETRMFLTNASTDAARRLQTLQARDLVVRNLLALSSGIQKTAFWDLWHDTSDRGSANALMYGTLHLLDHEEGNTMRPTALGGAYARMTAKLGDATRVERLQVADVPDVFAFRVSRSRGVPVLVAWRRTATAVDDATPKVALLPWSGMRVHVTTLSGESIEASIDREGIRLPLSSEPIFVE